MELRLGNVNVDVNIDSSTESHVAGSCIATIISAAPPLLYTISYGVKMFYNIRSYYL